MKFLAISLFLGIAACSPVSMHPGEMPTLCILKEVNSFGTCLFARENADHFVAIGKAFETLQGGRQIGDFGNFIQKFAMFCHQTYVILETARFYIYYPAYLTQADSFPVMKRIIMIRVRATLYLLSQRTQHTTLRPLETICRLATAVNF